MTCLYGDWIIYMQVASLGLNKEGTLCHALETEALESIFKT
jgi:hypothetical protein